MDNGDLILQSVGDATGSLLSIVLGYSLAQVLVIVVSDPDTVEAVPDVEAEADIMAAESHAHESEI